MYLFLLMFFTIYGGMHAYVFWRLHTAFPNLGHWRWAILVFFLLMVIGPAAARMLEQHDFPLIAKVTATITFSWCAIVFWLFCYCALADAWTLITWGVGHRWPQVKSLVPSSRLRFLIPAGITVLSLAWGMVEVRYMTVPKIVVEVPNLPQGRDELRIMQISDVHLGITIGQEKLREITAVYEREKPDILVSTGDLADGAAAHLEESIDELAALDPPLGKYAVMGNHEFYVGPDITVDFHQRAGFQLLRGEAVYLDDALMIAGVDDPTAKRFGRTDGLDESRALSQANEDMAVVLLKHQPRIDPESAEKMDLQLSGHTHSGQIFPFVVFVAMSYNYYRGLYDIPGRAKLYVSRGTGTWGPKMRVLSPPETTIIILRRRQVPSSD